MSTLKQSTKPDIQELPQMKDRISFFYVEKCTITRKDSAIQLKDKKGISLIPSAMVTSIILGPGTTITHRAVELAADTGISLIWAGEGGIRYYAGGRSLSSGSHLLQKQAEYVSNQRKHLEIVRKIYGIRFPNENLSGLTLAQMRGKEGARMKAIYSRMGEQFHVLWNGRCYDPEDFDSSDPVNRALSSGNVCLYGVVHAVICAMGLSPGLGFIHVGLEKSFVYDIADLYKADIIIPLAFELASQNPADIAKEMRRCVRNKVYESKLIQRIVKDVLYLFKEGEQIDSIELALWNNARGEVPAGTLYTPL